MGRDRAMVAAGTIVLLVVVGCGQAISGQATPTHSAISSATATALASPTVDSGKSASANANPLGPTTKPFAELAVPGGIKPMTVRLTGDAAPFEAWRAATTQELERKAGTVPDLGILLTPLGGRDVLLAWTGGACDIGAALDVEARSLVLTEDRRPGCDAIGITKGIVLTSPSTLDVSQVKVDLVRAVLLP